MVREPDATTHPTLQDHQLMSKHRVLGFKPQLRLWRGTGWPERNRAARSFRQFRRFHQVINSNKVFGTHKPRYTYSFIVMDLHHLLLPSLPAYSGLPRSTGTVRPVHLVGFVP